MLLSPVTNWGELPVVESFKNYPNNWFPSNTGITHADTHLASNDFFSWDSSEWLLWLKPNGVAALPGKHVFYWVLYDCSSGKCPRAVSLASKIEPYAAYRSSFHGVSYFFFFFFYGCVRQRHLIHEVLFVSAPLASSFILMGSISNYLFIRPWCLSCGVPVLT